jgi:hypothetical protein
VTALVVARPLAAGEDPGRLHAPEAVSGIVLNFLWLVVALGGAVWLAMANRPFRLGGWLSVGLVGVAGVVLLSAGRSDGYRQPGWLTAVEWAMIPIIFILTRELTTDDDPDEDSTGGLLAAILASAVSVAGFAAYQAAADALRGRSPDLPLSAPVPTPPGDDLRELLPPSSEPEWVAHGTLERSDTFLGLLLLLTPVGIAYGLRDRSMRTCLTMAVALLLVAAAVLAGRDLLRMPLADQLKNGWTAAGKMIAQRPLTGVGPGNFDRHAPRLLAESAPELLAEPWGAYPELAATCGVPAALALLAVSVWALVATWRAGGASPLLWATGGLRRPLAGDRPPRWEFYIGGVTGLLLGLLLRVLDLPGSEEPNTILYSAYGAVGRALIWFVAFALFEGVRWPGPTRRNELLIGLGLVLVFGLVSGALLRPVVMQTFWVIAALALAGEPLPDDVTRPPILIRTLPAGLMLVAAIAYFVLLVQPAVTTAQLVAHAHRAASIYATDRIHYDAEVAVKSEEKQTARRRAKVFLETKIVAPLAQAVRANPGDADLQTELAGWARVNWKFAPNLSTDEILKHTQTAATTDPYNAVPLVREFQLRATFATIHPNVYPDPKKYVEYTQKLRDEQFAAMDKLIPEILTRDPSMDARLRYRKIQSMIEVKDDKRYTTAINTDIPKLIDDDNAETRPRWKLTTNQRRQLDKWLKGQ